MAKAIMFSTKAFERDVFQKHNQIEWKFVDDCLDAKTAYKAEGYDAVCVFVTDKIDEACLKKLAEYGVKLVALRSAGFNHVDLKAAKSLGITVVRVPKYSPQAVAEFAVGLYLSVNRKIHRAHDRVKDGNFSIGGLIGHDVWRQTIGIIGCGSIGKCAAQIFRGFGAKVVAHDPTKDTAWANKYGVEYVDLEKLLQISDVVSLHAPLNASTRHLINSKTISQMKKDSYLINTSRGGLVDTKALIAALKARHFAGAALDVYEEEEHLFFQDHSEDIIDDDQFAILNTIPTVLITSHQAFLTQEAMDKIANVTTKNIISWQSTDKTFCNQNTV